MKQQEITRFLFSKRINNDYSNIDELEEFFNVIKGNSEGYTKIQTLDPKDYVNFMVKNMHYKKLSEVFLNTHGIGNLFFSVNSFNTDICNRNIETIKTKNGRYFKSNSNKVENLSTLNCIVMDIDLKDSGNEHLRSKSQEEIISLIRNIKEPTYIISSGHGYHVYYNLENYTFNKNLSRKDFLKIKDRYILCCNVISEKFKRHNIMTDDNVTGRIEKLIRVPYSYNLKDVNDPKRTIIIYKNTQVLMNLKDLYKKCFKLSNNITVKTIKRTELKIKTHNYKNCNSFEELPSYSMTPNKDYPTRGTQYINFNIFFKNAIDDIKLLAKRKDYENSGRRNMIFFHLISVINDYNEKYEDKIDAEELFLELNESYKLPEKELYSLLNRKTKCKTSKEYLVKLMGVNKVDETYMKSLVISKDEFERRSQIRIKKRNESEKEQRRINKELKIQKENDLIRPLIGKYSVSQITELTGIKNTKVKNIIKRIKNA